MQIEGPVESRDLLNVHHHCDVAVVGGGLSGVCSAVAAARSGSKVVLIQDRPVLGGNASSEIRMWAVGATSHMGNNNRWAREGGIVDEILVENVHRNSEGNALIFDSILLEKVVQEPNITLLLNTAVFQTNKQDADTIASVTGFCSQNSTLYHVAAKMFIDASGDGIVGFQGGAAFRMGAESKDEFDEGFAPSKEYGELLGHTLYFYSKDAGRPVKFTPPSFALKDITKIPRWRNFKLGQEGCQLWWIEYGGRFDTIHDTERIKWELWSIIYGVWNHIKNSGQFPDSENMVLEWVGTIPGKRESRRFEGDYMLSQKDIIEQRTHDDAISHGGWAIDLHPADGVYSEAPGCNQWHSKGVYQIPLRCLYSRNINNLFVTGRLISATHVAFGSTRVMLTCAVNGQVAGTAAALCARSGQRPVELTMDKELEKLRIELDRTGHFIPGVQADDPHDIAKDAEITPSSQLKLDEIPSGSDFMDLEAAVAMMVPVQAGPMPKVGFWYRSDDETVLDFQLRTCSRSGSYTPDSILARASHEHFCSDATAKPADVRPDTGSVKTQVKTKVLTANMRYIEIDFDTQIETDRYVMVCIMPNEDASVALSDKRYTGLLALERKVNKRVGTDATQRPPADIGVDSFEFWIPSRRPDGKNLGMTFDPPIDGFSTDNLKGGAERPTNQANAWIADFDDKNPYLDFKWSGEKQIRKIVLALDTDFDHPMETVLMKHPETEIPFCASEIKVYDSAMNLIGHITDNYQTRPTFEFDSLTTSSLRLEFLNRNPDVPVSVFRVRIYE